jgi:hypothetical protein
MANNSEQNDTNTEDRRDLIQEGSSLSGSKKRNNDATEKGLHPEQNRDQHTGMSESGVNARRPDEEEVVDQDPGERQKRNQAGEKDDPLAA